MLHAMPEPISVPPPIFGVTLEQYAGVNAAVLEGFGLPEVLASEGLDAAMWPRRAAGWSGRIALAGVGGPVSLTYQEKLAFAQEWLGRRIEPLCDDLDAWFGFLGAWSAHPAPFDLLTELGLQATDVARVQGAWTQRIAADEKPRKRVVEVARKRLSAVPKVTVKKATLRPFPWSLKAAPTVPTAPRTPAAPAFFDDALGLDGYAEIVAELGIPRANRVWVLAGRDLREEAFVALEAVWNGWFAADAILVQDFRRLVAHSTARRGAAENSSRPGARENPLRREAVPGIVVAPPELPIALQRVVPAFTGTALALDLPRGPTLPFLERMTVTAITADPADEEARIARSPVNLGGTALSVDVPRGPAASRYSAGLCPRDGGFYGQLPSFHQGFWLCTRSHTDWQVPLLHARAAGPPRGHETGMLQQVPGALGTHSIASLTTRLHRIVPGHSVFASQAVAVAPGHAPWAATEMP